MKKSKPKGFLLRKQFLRIMKIYVVLVCISVVKLFASNANAQAITLKVENAELKLIFKKIEAESNYHFFYNNSLINVSEKASINAESQKIESVLTNLLSDTNIDFKIFKNQIVLFPRNDQSVINFLKEIENKDISNTKDTTITNKEISSLIVKATQQPVTGLVTDEDGLPLPGVSIQVQGTTRGTTTDFEGRYQIIAEEGEVLEFTYIGMETQSVTVGSNKTINLVLKEKFNELDAVIVVAYGTTKKSDFTGSATQIDAANIEMRPISNFTSAIEGSSAGVTVTSASGQPGSGQSIRIRGYGSYSASSDPLYVVDGIPFNGYINSINPNDIESITILKDASSTALYGNKAGNGVVMITTKSGKNRKGEFSINISSSIVDRAIPEYERLNPDQYYEIMWEALRNSRAIPGIDTDADVEAANLYASNNIYDELLSNPYNVPNDQIVGVDGKINPNATLIYDDLDWEDAVTRVGYRQNYDISYQGGTEKGDYYASLGYLDEEGYLINSDFSRISGRLRVNYQANDWLKTGLNIGVTTSKGNQAQATSSQSSSFVNPVRFARGIGPIYNIYKHDASGAYVLDENGNKIYDLDITRPSGASNGRHIVAEMKWNEDLDEITSISGRTYFNIQFTEGLTFTTNASFDQRHYYNTDFENKFVGDAAGTGRAGRTYNRRTVVGFNQLLNYTLSLNESHNFNALLGHESLEMKFNELDGSRSEIIADGNTELINFVTTLNLNSYEAVGNDESYFGRFNYDYKQKYYFSLSYRTDASSKFARETRWGNFWSLGLAWRLDQEEFIKNQTWINLLKLRASYGEIGNNSGIDLYAYQGLYDLGYNNQSESGFLQATLENRNLEWEKSASSDIAIEFRFFDRLNGVVEYYNRESDNLLFDVPLPLSSGSSSITQNIGTMYNKGIEISLDYDVIKTENFKWNFGFNAATIENEFTKLPQEEIINGSKKLMVGHSIYDYWLKDWYGVDPADGSPLYFATQEAIDANDDDIRIVEGNTLTTDQANAEYHYAGTAIPDLTGAITNSFRYKDFNLIFMFTYQLGGENLDYNYQGIMSSGTYGTALSTDILGRWQKPGDITDIPRMDVTNTTDSNATSDRWLVDSSFLNLRQINFMYNLPAELQEVIGVTTAQVYLSAENVFSINSRKGLNIQEEFNGTTSNVYTPSRIVSLGLNIKF
ncbi:TonB-dependent receptor [Abyssalbus ytuae]|uniref:TonB-dependent receptor n=1 Tax=Abyssalbus ytuae TaxID=2926907 RepID=A0A9E6ZMN6_9FLAO|nr:TonB-dependent receptor [Abyssalbus ytuae]UOB17135.1 TonB-dependent receptor [Abyssalbus ytuae]